MSAIWPGMVIAGASGGLGWLARGWWGRRDSVWVPVYRPEADPLTDGELPVWESTVSDCRGLRR